MADIVEFYKYTMNMPKIEAKIEERKYSSDH